LVSDEDLTFGVWRGVRVEKGAAIRSRERSATICNLDRVLPHFGIQGAPAQLIVEFCVICRRFSGQLSLFDPKDAKFMQVSKGI
jgi:hypothetical protein